MNYTAINIFSDLKNTMKKTANHNTQRLITEFGNFAYVSGPFLLWGRLFISFRNLISTSLQCRMVSRLIWSCSLRSLEPYTTYGTWIGCPELSEIVRQHLYLNSFPASNWPWLGFASTSLLSKTVKKLSKHYQMASTWPWLNSGGVSFPSPTSSTNLGSKNVIQNRIHFLS